MKSLFAKEIATVIAFKIVAVFTIWYLFYSDHDAMVEPMRVLLPGS